MTLKLHIAQSNLWYYGHHVNKRRLEFGSAHEILVRIAYV